MSSKRIRDGPSGGNYFTCALVETLRREPTWILPRTEFQQPSEAFSYHLWWKRSTTKDDWITAMVTSPITLQLYVVLVSNLSFSNIETHYKFIVVLLSFLSCVDEKKTQTIQFELTI